MRLPTSLFISGPYTIFVSSRTKYSALYSILFATKWLNKVMEIQNWWKFPTDGVAKFFVPKITIHRHARDVRTHDRRPTRVKIGRVSRCVADFFVRVSCDFWDFIFADLDENHRSSFRVSFYLLFSFWDFETWRVKIKSIIEKFSPHEFPESTKNNWKYFYDFDPSSLKSQKISPVSKMTRTLIIFVILATKLPVKCP